MSSHSHNTHGRPRQEPTLFGEVGSFDQRRIRHEDCGRDLSEMRCLSSHLNSKRPVIIQTSTIPKKRLTSRYENKRHLTVGYLGRAGQPAATFGRMLTRLAIGMGSREKRRSLQCETFPKAS
jgi:hypothetical protein